MINAQDTDSLRTPLMLAARMANQKAQKCMKAHEPKTSIAIRDLLLSHGANPKTTDKTGESAIYWFNVAKLPIPVSAIHYDQKQVASSSQTSNSSLRYKTAGQCSHKVEALAAPKPGAYIPPHLRNKK